MIAPCWLDLPPPAPSPSQFHNKPHSQLDIRPATRLADGLSRATATDPAAANAAATATHA